MNIKGIKVKKVNYGKKKGIMVRNKEDKGHKGRGIELINNL